MYIKLTVVTDKDIQLRILIQADYIYEIAPALVGECIVMTAIPFIGSRNYRAKITMEEIEKLLNASRLNLIQ